MSKKKQGIDLVISDYLKYIPQPKRDNYELILRRCNFTDVTDPLFPVMLFLLFLQDNLTDTSEKVAREVKILKKGMVPHLPEHPKKQTLWRIVCILLILMQIMLSSFCLLRITEIRLPGQNPVSITAPELNEIQKINDYWELKLEQERQKMNWNEWMNDDVLRIALPAMVFFLILMLLQIILMFLMIAKIIREDEKIFHKIKESKHDYRTLCNESNNKIPQTEISFNEVFPNETLPAAETKPWENADSPNFPKTETEEKSSAPKE